MPQFCKKVQTAGSSQNAAFLAHKCKKALFFERLSAHRWQCYHTDDSGTCTSMELKNWFSVCGSFKFAKKDVKCRHCANTLSFQLINTTKHYLLHEPLLTVGKTATFATLSLHSATRGLVHEKALAMANLRSSSACSGLFTASLFVKCQVLVLVLCMVNGRANKRNSEKDAYRRSIFRWAIFLHLLSATMFRQTFETGVSRHQCKLCPLRKLGEKKDAYRRSFSWTF